MENSDDIKPSTVPDEFKFTSDDELYVKYMGYVPASVDEMIVRRERFSVLETQLYSNEPDKAPQKFNVEIDDFLGMLRENIKFSRVDPENVRPQIPNEDDNGKLHQFIGKLKMYMAWELLDRPTTTKIIWFRTTIENWCRYNDILKIYYELDNYSRCNRWNKYAKGINDRTISLREECRRQMIKLWNCFTAVSSRYGINIDASLAAIDMSFDEIHSKIVFLFDKFIARRKELVTILISNFKKHENIF